MGYEESPYYHCRGRCKTRINATKFEDNYERKVQQLTLSSRVNELFNYSLDDSNLGAEKQEYVNERRHLLRDFVCQRAALSKARKLFVEGLLKFDDYSEFKKEFLVRSACLHKELDDNKTKLNNIDMQRRLSHESPKDILARYANWDIAD